MEQQKLTKPKRERKFISQTDFLRVEVRNLAAELNIDLKDTSRMKGRECREVLENLNRIKFNREKGLLRKIIAYLF